MKATQEQLQKSVCVLPWIHLNIWTDGRIIPCCINQETLFGHTQSDSVENAFNSATAVQFRKQMLSGELPESCRRCKMPEQQLGIESYRTAMNQKYPLDFEKILSGQYSEFITEWNLKYLDVRYSNLCNFACLTCDTTNSSGVAQEYKKINRFDSNKPVVQSAFNDPKEFYSFIEKNIHTLTEIYFCGGEPLLLKEHYEVLDLLIKHKKFDVELRYNTNLSHLNYQGYSVVDLWKHFSRVRVGASLDASHLRAEYMRKGTRWTQIEKNREILLKDTPHVYFLIQPTVQLMNAFHLPNFHLEWIEKGYATTDTIFFNILTDPSFYALNILPQSLKAKVEDHWRTYQQKIQGMGADDFVIQQINGVIHFLNSSADSENLVKKFKSEIRIFDQLRTTQFNSVFTEFAEL